MRPILRVAPLVVLCSLSACQSGPPAEFHYSSTRAWASAHPLTEEGFVVGEVWEAPTSDGRLLRARGEVPLHFHADREEWVYVLEGRGSMRIGPTGAGNVEEDALTSYPLAAGDLFLIPRRTAHDFSGSATVLSIFSPGMGERLDRVYASEGESSALPGASSTSRSQSPERNR